jgi:hypothetical protein
MRTVFGFLAFFVSSALLSQTVDIPVTNWTVPPYSHSSGGITTMTDFTPPRVFVAVTPCRVVDTRNPAGPYGGPALATNVVRMFDIDNGPCPGIPAGADAYSLNFGGILPPADGFLTAWPTGISQPVVSQLNLVGGEVVANAAIVPAGTNGSINVLVNIGPTHVYIDINGYFSDTLGNPQNYLELYTNSTSFAAFFRNTHPACDDSCGVSSWIDSSSNGSFAVLGYSTSTTGYHYGVRGIVDDSNPESAGVFGSDGGGTVPGTFESAGVRGESAGGGTGVLGLVSDPFGEGVTGSMLDVSGNVLSGGHLGFNSNIGVYFVNGLGGFGTKNFLEPHPTDASKVIRYVSLEGREAGTYFRGRGKFQNGIAVIAVPEDFRMVTDAEGLSIQVTPIGQMATVAVESIGLDRIVVRGSRNVEFFYTVNGERRAYKNAAIMIENEKFLVPESPNARLPRWLSEDERQRLVTNGTYNPDGTVNMETARRLGWDRAWAARDSRPAPEPAP